MPKNKMTKKKHYGRMLVAALLMIVVGSTAVAAADVLSPAAQRGLVLVRTNCVQCHAIDKTSDSPLRIAPPFRTLHTKYPIESLRRPLSEGVVTGHPTMPVFRLDPGQVEDVLAYLKTLEG
jgi:mono/diheme cytochrome c family protein